MIIAERELAPLILTPPPNVMRVCDEASEGKLFEFLDKTFDVGFDLETTVTKDFYWRRIRTMQFGVFTEQYLIDFKDYCDGNSDLLFNCQGNYGINLNKAPKLQTLLQKLSKYLCSDKWTKTGVNVGFEYENLYWLCGLRTYGYYDCLLAEKCLYAGLGGEASLKNYEFYSMGSMFERYFGKTIDKTLQTSFTLEGELSQDQIEYAALDTRTPLSIKIIQTIIANGETPTSLKAKGKKILADYLYYLDSIIFGDKLHDIIKIENEAIGSFIDMHVHGERIDRPRWLARVQKAKEKLVTNFQELDKIFIPLVGSKNEMIDEAQIASLEADWKTLGANRTDEEINMRLELSPLKRAAKKNPLDMDLNIQIAELEIKISQWEEARKAQKDILKKQCGDLKKKRTKLNNLRDSCDGEALINYNSDTQLLKILADPENIKLFPQLFNKKGVSLIEGLDDDTLEEYNHAPVMKLIQTYHGLSKEIGTYGDSWATEWATHPCKEEGWLNPGDGRLHSTFNQLDAATGRSSSEQPNGQNLPKDKEVRSCFIADDPDENVRISDCCEADTEFEKEDDLNIITGLYGYYRCTGCGKACSTHAEEQAIVTADMAGAELCIIADDANDPVWINAFAKDEDVHSVGTELLFDIEWHHEALPDCTYYAVHTEETVAKNPLCILGDFRRGKCECPMHQERRDENKKTNFLLAYGGGPSKLAVEIKKSIKEAKQLMALHEMKNPNIWAYLKKSGDDAARDHKAFDLFGRRRLLPEPTRPRAIDNCREYNEKKLRLSDDECKKNIEVFLTIKGKKPNKSEEFELSHRQPTADEISRSYFQLSNGINRQGKNHRIQGTNATIIKIAMGSGHAPDGTPFLFHTLPLYKARLIKMVHDELVIGCPKRYATKVSELVGEAFAKAAAIKMKRVKMKFSYHVEKFWSK